MMQHVQSFIDKLKEPLLPYALPRAYMPPTANRRAFARRGKELTSSISCVRRHVPLRSLPPSPGSRRCQVLAIVLFACVANSYVTESDSPQGVCAFKRDANVCSWPWGIGVSAFLASGVCIAVEMSWERLAAYHRYVYMSEMVFAGLWSFFCFISFCMLASAWNQTDASLKDRVGRGNPIGAITGAFFSTLSWAVLSYISYKGYKEDDIVSSLQVDPCDALTEH
jgi:hypothetical protein